MSYAQRKKTAKSNAYNTQLSTVNVFNHHILVICCYLKRQSFASLYIQCGTYEVAEITK